VIRLVEVTCRKARRETHLDEAWECAVFAGPENLLAFSHQCIGSNATITVNEVNVCWL
jgi:hypothetical protein